MRKPKQTYPMLVRCHNGGSISSQRTKNKIQLFRGVDGIIKLKLKTSIVSMSRDESLLLRDLHGELIEQNGRD